MDEIKGKGLRLNREVLVPDIVSKKKEQQAEAPKKVLDGADKVDLSHTRSIRQFLDNNNILEERRTKIENLKKLIASGEYNPDSKQVAQAVAEEISLEIITE